MSGERNRLVDVALNEASLAPASPNVEQERRIALFDLKEGNSFAVRGADRGPYALALAVADGRLEFDVSSEAGERVSLHYVPLSAFRKLIKDYFLICDSYYAAIKSASPSQIEAIDMGRRAMHNDGAELLMKALDGAFEVDQETARRLFTLICALQARG